MLERLCSSAGAVCYTKSREEEQLTPVLTDVLNQISLSFLGKLLRDTFLSAFLGGGNLGASLVCSYRKFLELSILKH